MFANFTEETCTGTGNTIELAGATSGNIPFSASFADGDLIAYVIEDSGGTIKVSGVGEYVAATDDIVRHDTWSWNGTSVNDDPFQTNLTLSAGIHIIRCDAVSSVLRSLSTNARSADTNLMNAISSPGNSGGIENVTANEQRADIFRLQETAMVNSLNIGVLAAGTGSGAAQIGLTRCIDGLPDSSYIVSGSIDCSTLGDKSITFSPILLEAGWYFCHYVTDDSSIDFNRGSGLGDTNWTPLQTIEFSFRWTPGNYYWKSGVTGATLDPDPSTVTGQPRTNSSNLSFRLGRA